MLTFKLSRKTIALQCAVVILPHYTEYGGEPGVQRLLWVPELLHLHLPRVPTLCLPLDSQTIADASMTWKKE